MQKQARTFGNDGRKRRGRPPENRFRRRMEIYESVCPLLLRVGARRLTMRQAAEAACLSIGGLYHYFSTKRDLVLFPLKPEVCAETMAMFERACGHLRDSDPEAYLDAFVQMLAGSVGQLRPAVHAAFELGSETSWAMVEGQIAVELEDFVETLQALGLTSPRADRHLLARSIKRTVLAALLDRGMGPEELRAELLALIRGRPLRGRRRLPSRVRS